MHALSSNIEFASTFVIICASMTRWVARKISEKYNYVKVCGVSCIEGLLVESPVPSLVRSLSTLLMTENLLLILSLSSVLQNSSTAHIGKGS